MAGAALIPARFKGYETRDNLANDCDAAALGAQRRLIRFNIC
jgi:hypothetical protein